MELLNKKGNVLLFAVVAITAISALGTGIYFMTSTSTFSGISGNDKNRAYQLALAGKDYALVKNLPATTGRDFTFANGDKFRLDIAGDTITSTGIVKEDTPYEARRTITTTITGFSSKADVSFASDITSFTAASQSKPGFITTDTTTGQVSLGKTTMKHTFGALWYKGNAASGDCVGGKCKFGKGFRAFFVFKVIPPSSGSTGNGFTFAFFNGSINTSSSVGGYAISSSNSRGELLGYAGNSYNAGSYLDGTGTGIQPPKIAIEFDPNYNACNSLCDGNAPANGSRCDEESDPPNNKNHMALVFWGENSGSSCCGIIPGGCTFDDNRHGAGGGSNETFSNALNPTQAPFEKCYYFNGNKRCIGTDLGWPGNWLINTTLPNIYAFRLEVTRKLDAETSGDHKYRIKAWIKPCTSSTCSSTTEYPDGHNYTNTKYAYTDDDPTIDREIEMSETYHTLFETMFFGWTTASGDATSEVALRRFRINFQ